MPNTSEKIPERYSIVQATAEDAPQVRQVIHDSWIKTMSENLNVPPERLEECFAATMTEEGLAMWREQLSNPPEGHATFVAKEGATVLGVCIVQRRANPEGENELALIHVKPGETESGIGDRLWRTAEKALDPEKDTFLWTTPGTKAVGFYERREFKPVEYATEQLRTTVPLSRPRVKMVKKAEAVPR